MFELVPLLDHYMKTNGGGGSQTRRNVPLTNIFETTPLKN